MIRRRSTYDALQATDQPCWLVVRSMSGATLEVRPIPAGADLKRVLIAAMLEWLDAGWQLGEFSSTVGGFFCRKGIERRAVSIQPMTPIQSVNPGSQG
jgi:hypothetical protein